jgi:hypothetical protein
MKISQRDFAGVVVFDFSGLAVGEEFTECGIS